MKKSELVYKINDIFAQVLNIKYDLINLIDSLNELEKQTSDFPDSSEDIEEDEKVE